MSRFPQVGDQFGRFRTLARPIAVKVLNPVLSDDQDFRARFSREATVLARLDSPHIVQMHESGAIDGCLYMTIQLVTGGDLHSYVAQDGLRQEQGLGVVAPVCLGFDDAHNAGIVHRDVKPSNVPIRSRGSSAHAHMCDFGIALGGGTTHTRTGVMIGSLAYMARERHEGHRADERDDIYSLGCLLYDTPTGNPPYNGTDVQVAMAHVTQAVPRLAGSDPATSELNRIPGTSMAKDPADRHPSAEAISDGSRRIPASAAATPMMAKPGPHPTPVVPAETPAAGAPTVLQPGLTSGAGSAASIAEEYLQPEAPTILKSPLNPVVASPAPANEDTSVAPGPARTPPSAQHSRTARTQPRRSRRTRVISLAVLAVVIGLVSTTYALGQSPDADMIAVGNSFACTLAPDDTAWCWGDHTPGLFWDGTSTKRATPNQLDWSSA